MFGGGGAPSSSSSSSSDDENPFEQSDIDEPFKDEPLYPEDVQDLVGNGDVLKKVVRPGKNDHKPHTGDTVFIHYTAVIKESGTVFFSTKTKGESVCIKLGEHGNLRGLDLGVPTMNEGEVAKFTCRPHFAYLESGLTRQVVVFEVELLNWTHGDDLSGDGDITRSIQQEGQPDTQPSSVEKAGDDVLWMEVHVVGYHIGEKFVDRDVNYELGSCADCYLPDGVDFALNFMNTGERALVKIIGEKWSYGPKGSSEYNLPPFAEVVFDLTLKNWTKRSVDWYNTIEDKLNAMFNLKNHAKRLIFEGGKFKEAIEKYDKVIFLLGKPSRGIKTNKKILTNSELKRMRIKHHCRCIIGLERPEDNPLLKEASDNMTWGEFEPRRDHLYLTCLLNAAYCNLKCPDADAEEVIRICDLVLEDFPGNPKALFRRGKAREIQNKWAEALEDFVKVLNIEPHNPEAIEEAKFCRDPPKTAWKPKEEEPTFDDILDEIMSTRSSRIVRAAKNKKPKPKAHHHKTGWTIVTASERSMKLK